MHIFRSLFVFLLNAPPTFATWRHSPVVIGGTGGSGTRGVLDILQKLSIYMAPARGSKIFRKCFNGEPLDNSCMVPVGSFHHNSTPNYYNWLMNGTCNDTDTNGVDNLRLEPWGQHYIDSVPDASRSALRWGWKIPTTMYHLDRICKMFPGLVFIQAVRNPLDMASTFYEHLPYRVKEFKSIHNGYANAANVLSERCATAKRSEAGSCALLAKELIVMGKCDENLKQRKHCDLTETSEGWRCLEMQLWAEMNYGVYTFALRCFEPVHKYVLWHTEDCFGLRGRKLQSTLQEKIADVLGYPLKRVQSAFPTHRRLQYGKYMTSKINITKNVRCANTAEPKALQLFGYRPNKDTFNS